jgi:hypothetical protein
MTEANIKKAEKVLSKLKEVMSLAHTAIEKVRGVLSPATIAEMENRLEPIRAEITVFSARLEEAKRAHGLPETPVTGN